MFKGVKQIERKDNVKKRRRDNSEPFHHPIEVGELIQILPDLRRDPH